MHVMVKSYLGAGVSPAGAPLASVAGVGVVELGRVRPANRPRRPNACCNKGDSLINTPITLPKKKTYSFTLPRLNNVQWWNGISCLLTCYFSVTFQGESGIGITYTLFA